MRGIKRLLIASAYMLAVFFFFGISALANGTINTGTIHHDGIERTYEYYVPSSYDGSQPTELLFSFHGLGSDAPGQRSLTNFEAIAEKEGFIAVFPNATRLENDVGVPLPDLPNSEVQWNV